MATNAPHVDNYDPSTYWTAPARNFRSSARLHLQHTLFQNTLGYLLEPAVDKSLLASPQPPRVADLACGNGVWLTDLHSHLAKSNRSAQLDGFDINPVNFPDAAYLPDGVTLKELDVLAKPLPAALVGVYDVVHVRAFVSVLPDGNLEPLLSVVSALLKPGGFIQWEETRGDIFTVEPPSPQVSRSACDGLVQVIHGSLKARGTSNAWVETLDKHLQEFGFKDARLLVQEKRKQDKKAWTEDYLMVWEELAGLFPTKAEAPAAPMPRETWVDMFANGVKETEQGVVIHQERVFTVVGQKPQ